jgi:hypothetical protein
LIYDGGVPNEGQIGTIRKNFRILFDSKGLGFVPDHFFNANGAKLILDDSKVRLSEVVKNSDKFKAFDEKLKNKIIDLVKNDKFTDDEAKKISPENGYNSVNFSELDFDIIPFTEMFLLMGGTKQTDVLVKVYEHKTNPKKVAIQLGYVFHDTFGADYDDVNCGSKTKLFIEPLKHFFVLQHYSNVCSTCRPFETEFSYFPTNTLFFAKP